MEIFTAHNQWANRPPDERYWSVAELKAAQQAEQAISRQWDGALTGKFGVSASTGALMYQTPNGTGAIPSHWAMSQMCAKLGAPHGYLATLPGDLAARNLNHALGKADVEEKSQFLVRCPAEGQGLRSIRAMTSTKYGRLWNTEVLDMCEELVEQGWRVPPARPNDNSGGRVRLATAADVLTAGKHGISVKVGDEIAPAGVYAGDRDMFVFLVNEDRAIEVDGFTGFRGVFIQNSEVGAKSFGLTMFLYESVCGNHIVWDSRVFADLRTRHTRGIADRFKIAHYKARQAGDLPAGTEGRLIEAARKAIIGDTKDTVINAVYEVLAPVVTRADVEASYVLADQYADVHRVSPRTAWGMAGGLTRHSQTVANADRREAMDRAAGQLVARYAQVPADRLLA